jgi:HAD superfamily hydrolase (TIGR01549 family)
VEERVSRLAPPVEFVWFDMDDTLFDHAFAARRGLEAVWREDARLRALTFRDVQRRYVVLLDEVTPSITAPAMTHAEARQERFRRLYEGAGTDLSRGEARAISDRYREIYQRSRRPVPGAAALLRWLTPRVPVGIVSNNHTAEQEDKLRAIGLRTAITHLVTSEDVGTSKPDPAIFHHALEKAGVPAERSVMVGDRWATDVLGARAAGVRPIWLNRWAELRPDDAGTVEELRSFRPLSAAGPVILGTRRRGAPGPDRHL